MKPRLLAVFAAAVASLSLCHFAVGQEGEVADTLGVADLPEVADVVEPKPAAPTEIMVRDMPNDAGIGLVVKWKLSTDDTIDPDTRTVKKYRVMRSTIYKRERNDEGIWEFTPDLKDVVPTLDYGAREAIRTAADLAADGADTVEFEGPFQLIKDVPYGPDDVEVPDFGGLEDQQCIRGVPYKYQITALTDSEVESDPLISADPIAPSMQFFDFSQKWFLIILLVIGGAVAYFIEVAKSGKDLKVREIAGLQAVEEAVGRATEMGRSCLYIPGIGDMNEIQTIASMTILGRLSKVAAEHDAQIEVPNCRSLVMTTARETVQAAFLAAGRPDAYNENLIYYVTDEQFGYVAAVAGTMVRDKPAACFYLGQFYAESLILAETGNSIGAIQIAGTAMPAQLPFFVAACDYTLIGEEFYAASAYLSGEAHQLGSLKGQDVGKTISGLLVVVGCLLMTLGALMHKSDPEDKTVYQKSTENWAEDAADYIKLKILSKGE